MKQITSLSIIWCNSCFASLSRFTSVLSITIITAYFKLIYLYMELYFLLLLYQCNMSSKYFLKILDLQYPILLLSRLSFLTFSEKLRTHIMNFKFLYSTSSTLLPMVGVVVTTWFIKLFMYLMECHFLWNFGILSYSLYKMVVLPALSKPTIISFTCVLEKSLFHRLLNKMPII